MTKFLKALIKIWVAVTIFLLGRLYGQIEIYYRAKKAVEADKRKNVASTVKFSYEPPSKEKETKPYKFLNVRFDDYKAASSTLKRMQDVLSSYGFVTASSLYTIANNYISTAFSYYVEPIDSKYGWTDLSGVRIKKFKGRYRIGLPQPILVK